MKSDEAGPEARLVHYSLNAQLLRPVAAARAGTGAVSRAVICQRTAQSLRDREVRPTTRVSRDQEARGGARAGLHLTRAGAQVEPGPGRGDAVGVGLLGRVTRLELAHHVA